ncbi:MAG: hypothetical protein IPN44_02895 [Flavobacteriales bacterium]|nr:hypothetical protein [Flavobacteriales bacterium]
MNFNAQVDEMLTALRHTHARLLAPVDHQQLLLPTDPEIFVEDIVNYVMDEWRSDLRKEGHVLEQNTSWKDPASHYPRYALRLAGGDVVDILFSGTYPQSLFLHVSKAMPGQGFSDAKAVQVPLLVSNDAGALLYSILGGLKEFVKA